MSEPEVLFRARELGRLRKAWSQLPLSQGKFALVDEEDFDRLSEYQWWAHKANRKGTRWYALRYDGVGKALLLHRAVLNAAPGTEIDHINRDGLDCRKENLRYATRSQNSANRLKVTRPTSSRFKGVHWDAFHGHWRANAGHRKIGCYRDEVEAAQAYDKAVLEKYGEFAVLNFPVVP